MQTLERPEPLAEHWWYAPRADAGLSLVLLAVVVFLDQTSKAGAWRYVRMYESRNSGLLFGMDPGPRLLLVLISICVIATFVVSIARVAAQVGASAIGPTLIVGGMLGNAIDRLRFGSVRDFVPVGGLIINVADIAIVLGIVVTCGSLLVRFRQLQRASLTVRFDARHLRAAVVARD
jgi:signal peptidase II